MEAFVRCFSKRDLLLFDHVINVSNQGFSGTFQSSINRHLQKFGVSIDALPRCNESPLSIPAEFLESKTLNRILDFYHDDYVLLGMQPPKVSDFSASDFDYVAFAKENSIKLDLSNLYYDVSSKFYQKDIQNKHLRSEKEEALALANNLRDKFNKLNIEHEYLILQVAQLQEDCERLIYAKEKADKSFDLIINKQQLQISALIELIMKLIY